MRLHSQPRAVMLIVVLFGQAEEEVRLTPELAQEDQPIVKVHCPEGRD